MPMDLAGWIYIRLLLPVPLPPPSVIIDSTWPRWIHPQDSKVGMCLLYPIKPTLIAIYRRFQSFPVLYSTHCYCSKLILSRTCSCTVYVCGQTLFSFLRKQVYKIKFVIVRCKYTSICGILEKLISEQKWRSKDITQKLINFFFLNGV